MLKYRTLTIAGIDRSINLIAKTLTITDQIQARSTASFQLHDINRDLSLSEGQEVIIEEQGAGDPTPERIFAGTINEVISVQDGQEIFYTVTCVDYNQIADRLLVADAFDGSSAGDMVRAIYTQKLTAEGVTLGTIVNGPDTSRSVFDWIPVSQALNEIEQKTGIRWNIDFFKQLHFFTGSEFPAPFNLTETSRNYKNLILTKNREQYRNRQIFRPGDLETALQEKEKPSPAPDGSSQTFTLRFKLSRKPLLYIDGVQVDPATIGIKELETGKAWYWEKGSNTISQAKEDSPLAVGKVLEVDYYGLWRRIIVKDNVTEITARKALEGGTGIYESYAEKATVDTSEAAQEEIDGLLRKYGRIPNVLTYQTYQHGLRAGMVQNVNIPSRGINGDFLIESVNARADGRGSMVYNIKALDGEGTGSWTKFFRGLVEASRGFSISENEVVDLLAGVGEVELEDMIDGLDTYDANPPFCFGEDGGNIVWGRWEWLNYQDYFLMPEFPITFVEE